MSEPTQTAPAPQALPTHLAKQLTSAKAKADKIIADANIAANAIFRHAVDDISTDLKLTQADSIDPESMTYIKNGGA